MKKIFQQIFPFLLWISKLKDPHTLRRDILAGLTVALVLIPQSMAYAWLAGLPIEVGLYTSFIPVVIAGLFWSARQMSTGPVTIISLMTATALAPIAVQGSEGYIVYASLLALFIGIFYIILWSLRLGVIVEFLSHPVIIGFTNAVALITIISQIPKLLWLSIEKWGSLWETILAIINGIMHSIHIPSLIFWISGIIAMILLHKFFPRLPRVLIVLIFSIGASAYFGFHDIYGGKIVMDIPNHLPGLSFPIFNDFSAALWFHEALKLATFAIIIGIIGFTETISVAKIVGYKTRRRVAPNKELVAQWLANISSSMFWGYGVAGSFSKTAVNLRAGALTGFSSVVTGLAVCATIVFLTPLLYHLPFTTLAAVIIVAVYNLIKIEPIIQARTIEKHDAIVALLTFILTLGFAPNLERGILIWVILSLWLYIYRTMRPKLIQVAMYKDGELRDVELFGLKESKKVSVLRFDGILYFANCSHFETEVFEHVRNKKKLKYLIFDFEWMNNIDSSGLESLSNLIFNIQKDDIKVLLCGIRPKVLNKLIQVWFVHKIWEKNIYTTTQEAIEFIDKKLWKKSDIKHLQKYSPDKSKDPEIEKRIMKQIDEL